MLPKAWTAKLRPVESRGLGLKPAETPRIWRHRAAFFADFLLQFQPHPHELMLQAVCLKDGQLPKKVWSDEDQSRLTGFIAQRLPVPDQYLASSFQYTMNR
jgi:hypothetical protein